MPVKILVQEPILQFWTLLYSLCLTVDGSYRPSCWPICCHTKHQNGTVLRSWWPAPPSIFMDGLVVFSWCQTVLSRRVVTERCRVLWARAAWSVRLTWLTRAKSLVSSALELHSWTAAVRGCRLARSWQIHTRGCRPNCCKHGCHFVDINAGIYW